MRPSLIYAFFAGLSAQFSYPPSLSSRCGDSFCCPSPASSMLSYAFSQGTTSPTDRNAKADPFSGLILGGLGGLRNRRGSRPCVPLVVLCALS